MTKRLAAGAMSVGALCIASSALAQVTKQGDAYLFRAKYTAGKTIKYRMDTSGSLGTMNFTAKATLTEKTVSVSKGIGTITLTLGKPDVTLNGKPFKEFPLQSQTMNVKLDNRGAGTSGEALPTHIRFPEKAVAVGGKWQADSAQLIMGQRQQGKASFKLVGFETMAGQKVAKLAMTMEGSGAATVGITGFAWVSLADGLLMKETGKAKASTQNKTMPATFTLVRQ